MTYDESVAPLTVPADGAIIGDAFDRIRIQGSPDPEDPRRLLEVAHDSVGWVFVGTPNGGGTAARWSALSLSSSALRSGQRCAGHKDLCRFLALNRARHGIDWWPMRNPIIVALDVPTAEHAVELAARLRPYIGAVKVGSELFTAAGPGIVRALRAEGVAVFLDLKFHDIPNTVARAVESAVRLDVQMLTVHTSGGTPMLKAAQQSAVKTAAEIGCQPPVVLGVTVLTSLDDGALAQIGVNAAVADHVVRLAALAAKAGLGGLVCSPLELPLVRAVVPPTFQLVTPGIRMADAPPDDQKRTRTPREAVAAGATWLVVGRPILAAADPCRAAESILASLSG